ncbi:amino acid ABC transporter ATP-binding protein [Alloyangia pacifica]|uniref:Polar amino acid transport system ATP-binding protein n=1 Tax=Alloyangia pacifica TaxID=311180 RepID=A0A1I6UZA3_9RHOB|nr:amino acid ABC transporter ATP-binding protein [Alloyangia pacifica]SDI31692.1 polar amino acid transport system ATP-binding protein [Alloyangia pacifica]SFT06768.1 polar amino acid transport system ATP-binding protein [Alloyangia pacifica]
MSATDGPLLEVAGLEKTLGTQRVLRGVDFTVNRGEVLAIIGASGSGKSTLLRCLNLLIRPDNGRILWQGREVGWVQNGGKRMPARERDLLGYRTQISMVFQSFNLFPHMTALQNVMEAPVMVMKRPRDEVRAEAEALLEKVRLSHRAGAYPHQMSGGEQQRVAIARALAMRPEALLFDEVTSALDPELKGEVLSVMRDLASEGMTMVSVSHEMGFVRNVADRVVFMHKGRVCEAGDPKDVLANPSTAELQAFVRSVTD